jgi:hypothetical protein
MLVLVQQLRRFARRQRLSCSGTVHWLGDGLCGWLTLLSLQFGNPQVQPLHFLDDKQVDLS